MKLCNLGCGAVRPQSGEWKNVDQLCSQVSPEEWVRLQNEYNYIEHDISTSLPFDDLTFDGVLMAHVAEHFSVQPLQKLLKECLRILKPNGVLMVSVPDAHYFRHVYSQDKGPSTWDHLYGIHDPNHPVKTWLEVAMFFDQHYQVFSEDSLWCALTNAGFSKVLRALKPPVYVNEPCNTMAGLLDRISFSLVMTGTKA